ncbi:MAG: hypothetical protein IM600_17355 [Bacteroidetes bacterium]|nr:hypothetical protein [Bacteroidota bacterium]MCA6445199.1 hypothetical protein [Bacteroidota bacterium]
MQNEPDLRSHTHLQAAQISARPKLTNKYACPTRTDGRKSTGYNSKQAQFLAQGCSNAKVDNSQKLMPACNPLVVMRHNDGHKYNGKTRGNITVDNFSTLNISKQFFRFLLSPALRLDRGVLAIANLAHLPFSCSDAHPHKKSKELNSLPHFAFFKSILAIPKQSTFIFASTKAKINKLCCSPTKILHPP